MPWAKRKIGLVKRRSLGLELAGEYSMDNRKGVLRSPGSGLTVRSDSREALIACLYWFRTLFARWIRCRWPGKSSSALISPGSTFFTDERNENFFRVPGIG